MKEMKILSPTGILGYGFPKSSFLLGLEMEPDIIAVDAGSIDPGPYYLGSGTPFTTYTSVKRDLNILLTASCNLKIPLIIGTAGGSGGLPHLNRDKKIIFEIAKEKSLSCNLVTINSEFNKDYLLKQLDNQKIKPLNSGPIVKRRDIIQSSHIVGQMGVEPIIKALDSGADVVLCGRCYDPAIFAAPAIRAQYSEALSIHLGKILECAAIAADPGSGSDCMIGFLGEDYFKVKPLSPKRKCTKTSVAAHTLYEKSDPIFLPGPGGTLNLSNCEFTQEDAEMVKVTGSLYEKPEKYTIKLEGAKKIGYRTICIAGVRDPFFISNVNEILEKVRLDSAENMDFNEKEYHLNFIVYGKDGVMGIYEPVKEIKSHELGIIIDVVARTQEEANTICAVVRSTLLHYGYKGRLTTGGNCAFPFSPADFKGGEVYKFSLYALLETEFPENLFPSNNFQIIRGVVNEN